MKTKIKNPKAMLWQGVVIMLIGVAFLLYAIHPMAAESVVEWSTMLVVSIGLPLALVNIGLVLWATGTILQKLEEIKKSQPDKG